MVLSPVRHQARKDVAVVNDIAEYRHLRGGEDFKTFLLSASDVDLEIDRPAAPAQVVNIGMDDESCQGGCVGP
jgi:hypothetical protein